MTITILDAVRPRRLLAPVLLALSGLGWAAAHAFAHQAVMPPPTDGETAMHGYLSYLTTSFALCFALALPLAAGALAGRRWNGGSARSLWLFGLVPVLGFVGHSFAEPLFGGSGNTPFELAPIVAGRAPRPDSLRPRGGRPRASRPLGSPRASPASLQGGARTEPRVRPDPSFHRSARPRASGSTRRTPRAALRCSLPETGNPDPRRRA